MVAVHLKLYRIPKRKLLIEQLAEFQKKLSFHLYYLNYYKNYWNCKTQSGQITIWKESSQVPIRKS